MSAVYTCNRCTSVVKDANGQQPKGWLTLMVRGGIHLCTNCRRLFESWLDERDYDEDD